MVHFRCTCGAVPRSPENPVLVVVVVVVVVVVRGRPVVGTCCGARAYHSPPFTKKHLRIIFKIESKS